MDGNQNFDLLYLLALLILPTAALWSRFGPGGKRERTPKLFTVDIGGRTVDGIYWQDGRYIFIQCDAGRRGTPLRKEGPLATAEALLREVYGDGQIVSDPAATNAPPA